MTAKFFTIISFITVVLIQSGCSKWSDFGTTNVNPNGTETPSTAALLSNIEARLAGRRTAGGQGIPSILYCQYATETQYVDASLYALPKIDHDGFYFTDLYDLQNIIEINSNPETMPLAAKFGSANNQIAIAIILKSYAAWMVTDCWGDVPYSEALKGDAVLTPKYDTQEDIYKTLIADLTTAKDQFDDGAKATGDFIYLGNNTKWKQLANSLRMLMCLRLTKVYPNAGDYAATEFAKAFNDPDGYISDINDNLTLKFPGTAAYRSPWYNIYNGRSDYAETKLMTDFMLAFNDPRQALGFGSSTIGFPYGLTRDQAVTFGDNNTNYARIKLGASTPPSSPELIIGASHTLLAIAEAAQRGWIHADVEQFYKNGIAASWQEWGMTEGEAASTIDDYVQQSIASLTSDPLKKIQLQQYFAFYPDGVQGWSNWRRTGVPELIPTTNATNSSKQIPRRYVYGDNALNLNSANTQEAISRLEGGNVESARVWWDKE